MLKCS